MWADWSPPEQCYVYQNRPLMIERLAALGEEYEKDIDMESVQKLLDVLPSVNKYHPYWWTALHDCYFSSIFIIAPLVGLKYDKNGYEVFSVEIQITDGPKHEVISLKNYETGAIVCLDDFYDFITPTFKALELEWAKKYTHGKVINCKQVSKYIEEDFSILFEDDRTIANKFYCIDINKLQI